MLALSIISGLSQISAAKPKPAHGGNGKTPICAYGLRPHFPLPLSFLYCGCCHGAGSRCLGGLGRLNSRAQYQG